MAWGQDEGPQDWQKFSQRYSGQPVGTALGPNLGPSPQGAGNLSGTGLGAHYAAGSGIAGGNLNFSGRGVGGYSPAGSLQPNWGEASRYSQYSPEEMQNLRGISQLAGALGGGVGGYNQALSYYQAILGGDKAAAQRAAAPQQEQIAETYRGAQKGLEANAGLRGGARDQALAELARQKAGQMSGVIMQQQPAAAAAAGQLGLSGAQAAGGLASNVAQMAQQNRQFGIQAEQANRFQGINAMLQDKGLDINKALGFGQLQLGQAGLALQQYLGTSGLDLQRDLGQQGIDLQKQLGQAGINLSQQQLDFLKQQYGNQQQQQRGAKAGNLIGGGANYLLAGLGL